MSGPSESGLIAVLSRVGKPPEQQVNPDGSRILLLPYGARVLGLFAPNSDENFFWVHPAFTSDGAARAFFQSKDWHNTGGDRTWIAPEVDVFFPQYPDTEVWQVPPEIDPANYAAVQQDPTLRLASDITVALSRSRKTVKARISKRWGSAPNPLRHEPGWKELDGLAYAGYAQETSLELLDDNERSVPIGLWSLLAVPNGGEVIIPTHVRAEPEVFSGSISSADLKVTNHLVRFQTPGVGIRKIGVRAAASTGRLGYLYQSRDAWALIVRNFTVNPSGEYIDVPWRRSTASDALGYSTQACSVRNGEWDYCELEHHLPAIGFENGERISVDTSQVWAFRGPQSMIEQIAKSLLSADL